MKDESNNAHRRVLYTEELKNGVFNTGYRSLSQIIHTTWLIRGIGIFFIIIVYIGINSMNYYYPFLTLLTIIPIILIFYGTEVEMRKLRCSAMPITISEEGIQLYSSPLMHSIGHDGFIPISDIESIIVRRSRGYQTISRSEDGSPIRCMIWDKAPIEFIIRKRNGGRHRSGKKHPLNISIMVNLLHEKWNVPILEQGGGSIEIVTYEIGHEIP